MKKIIILTLILFSCAPITKAPDLAPAVITDISNLLDGDIVLQTSLSSQSQAIQLATHSKYSHVGIVVYKNDVAYVYEAHGPVGFRTLSSFINSGEGRHLLARRLKGGVTQNELKELVRTGQMFAGKPYDVYFNWDDSEIYCSELVWKIFNRALGVSVGEKQKLGDLDLSSPLVQAKLHERYGNNIPYGETVVTPAAIAESDSLLTIYED